MHACPLLPYRNHPRLGDLKVAAMASTASRPIPGFSPRRGDGRILGLNLFGVSKTAVPASDPDARIDFQFVDAGFDLSLLPFRLPYPVPFRLLGDEVKGWIEVGGCVRAAARGQGKDEKREAPGRRTLHTRACLLAYSHNQPIPRSNHQNQVTYLSSRVRISRGNKGTIFVLEKVEGE